MLLIRALRLHWCVFLYVIDTLNLTSTFKVNISAAKVYQGYVNFMVKQMYLVCTNTICCGQ